VETPLVQGMVTTVGMQATAGKPTAEEALQQQGR